MSVSCVQAPCISRHVALYGAIWKGVNELAFRRAGGWAVRSPLLPGEPIPAHEEQAIAVANDSIYGLNASVFTEDVDRARWVAGRLHSGTVGHNNVRSDFGMAFGGFKQSGIGREGGIEGLLGYLETKAVILEGTPSNYQDAVSRDDATPTL
jgi:hypothetical protein